MRTSIEHEELPLTIAALRLRVSYHAARTLMLRGELRARQEGNRWYVRAADVARLRAASSARASRSTTS